MSSWKSQSLSADFHPLSVLKLFLDIVCQTPQWISECTPVGCLIQMCMPAIQQDQNGRQRVDILGCLAEVQGQLQSFPISLLQLQAMHQVQCIAGTAWFQL